MKKTLTTLLFLAAALTLAAQPDSTLLQKTFSVGPDTKVLFSPGNLQYQPSTHLWRFASSQTETLGWQEKQSYPKYRGWIDLRLGTLLRTPHRTRKTMAHPHPRRMDLPAQQTPQRPTALRPCLRMRTLWDDSPSRQLATPKRHLHAHWA